jgi:hypothetical protein
MYYTATDKTVGIRDVTHYGGIELHHWWCDCNAGAAESTRDIADERAREHARTCTK